MGLEKINNKPLDYIEDESSEERSLFEKKSNEEESKKTQLKPEDFNRFDEESIYESEKEYLEDLKKQLEEHKAQMNEQIAFKSAFDKSKTR